ncbi:hypothetical protein [Rhizobium deserti]|nr:hypothetical protein [Rhizobium deserti]
MTDDKHDQKPPEAGTDDARSADTKESSKQRQEAVDKAAEMTSKVLKDEK